MGKDKKSKRAKGQMLKSKEKIVNLKRGKAKEYKSTEL